MARLGFLTIVGLTGSPFGFGLVLPFGFDFGFGFLLEDTHSRNSRSNRQNSKSLIITKSVLS